jgi:hypothetical protein
MFEALKTLGSFLGLLTSVVFFYDRIAKGRPIASLTITIKDGRKLVCIRISNPSDYDIAVLSGRVTPEVYFLTKDLESRNLMENQLGSGPYFMLKPKDARELILAPKFKDGVALEVNPQNIAVPATATARIRLPCFHLLLCVLCAHQFAGIPISADDCAFCRIGADRSLYLLVLIVNVRCHDYSNLSRFLYATNTCPGIHRLTSLTPRASFPCCCTTAWTIRRKKSFQAFWRSASLNPAP